MQFRNPVLCKEIRGINWEDTYLPKIFRSAPLNWHTFHHIYVAFWCQIFFCKYDKSS